MATALVHDPEVLLLDEPFNGMDPRQRLQLMDLMTELGRQGRVVLFSSHILEEVEQIAGGIEVMVAGRHAASGDFREIRRLMTERPHQYTIRSSDDRALAAALIADGSTSGVELRAGELHVQADGLRAVRPAAAGLRPGPRRTAVRGVAGRRVAGEGLLLPGDPMNAHRRPAHLAQPARPAPGPPAHGPAGDPAAAGRHRAAGRTARTPQAAVNLLGAFALGFLVPLVCLIAGHGLDRARRSTTARSSTCSPSRSAGRRSCTPSSWSRSSWRRCSAPYQRFWPGFVMAGGDDRVASATPSGCWSRESPTARSSCCWPC